MRNVLIVCVFAVAATSPLYPQTRTRNTTATVISVHRNHGVSPTSYAGSNPSDAPLQSRYYAYDIAVRLNCTNYVVRYESASDYLLSAFAARHQMTARLDDDRLLFEVAGYGQMDMPIVSHSPVKEGSCRSGGLRI